jgi:hypothetical protein
MVAGQVVGAETLPTVNPAPRIVPVQVTQPSLPTDQPKEEEPAPASGDKQLLMELLDGTRFGQRLDKNGIVIKGLTNGNFTASAQNQLAIGHELSGQPVPFGTECVDH